MANLAKIQSIAQGQFFVKDSLGNFVELKIGDTISLNDIVVAANSNTDLSKIEILFDTNELVVLNQGETLLDETLLASTFGNEELAFEKNGLDETLNAWNNTDGNIDDMETAAGDVTEQATNAGNEEAADGGALRSKFNSRDGDSADIVSDLRDTSFGGTTTQEPQEQIPTELLNPTATTPVAPTTPIIPVDTTATPAPTVVITEDVNNDGLISKAELDGKVDVTITVPTEANVGDTLNVTNPDGTITTVEITADIKTNGYKTSYDAPAEGGTITVSATITDKAGNTSAEGKDSAVLDTTTDYTLTSTASGDEENASITYTVTFTNPTTQAETVTFKVGNETITIDVPANSTGASKTVSYADAAKDYYQDVTNVPAPTDLSSTNNSKFEDLNPVNNAEEKLFEDHKDTTTVTIEAVKVTDKVITKDNLENNQGFTVKAKDPYGNDAKISTHTGPSGFGVESLAETTSGKLGQTDKVYSGHTSEIGVVKDGSTYKSESIEVEFKNPIQTLDVAFAWRHNGETARVDFYNGNEKVGYAIVSGGGNDVDAIIKYYDKNGKLKETVKAQGGTDNVDLVYTFKPAGDKTFTKAVFSAEGAGSDYLIHSISYKEVSDGDNTTIVGSDEVAFKISTSNIPDPSKYDFKTTFPTADVKIVDDSGKVVFEGTVNLDKNGNAIVTVRTDGTKDLKAEVSNVQGNFEAVDYENAKIEVESSIKATASNDSFTTLEDTNYILKTTDFGDNSKNVAKIKFDSVPENGKVYVLKSEYTGSMNDRAEYTSSENKVYIEVKAGDIVDISKIENGNVVFVPNKDTDEDGSFNFSVSNGNGNFSESYETKVNVTAVADAPEVSINITKVGIVTEGENEPSSNGIKVDYGDVTLDSKNTTITHGIDTSVDVSSGKFGGSLTTSNSSDTIKVGHMTGSINGGLGQDTLILGGNKADYLITIQSSKEVISYDQWKEYNDKNPDNGISYEFKNSKTGEDFTVANIEKINFADSGKSFDVYNVDISASLNDKDGSETLTVVIKGVPDGAKLYDLNGEQVFTINGEYNVTVPNGAKDILGSLTMKVPESYKGEINLQIEATATEKNDNTDGKNFATAEDTSHIDTPTIKVDPNTPNSINGGSGDDILIGDTGGASKNIIAGKNYNIALVVDTSGSMVESSGSKTAWGTTISRLDLLKDSLKNLANSLKGHDGKVNVSIIGFSAKADEPITFNDLTSENISDLIAKIDALKAEGGTNYEDAFLKTTSWFNTQNVTYGKAQGYENLTYFLTDGDPTVSNSDNSKGATTEYGDMKNAVDAFKTLSGQSTVHAIGIGNGINENYLRFFDNTDIIGKGDVSFGSWFWQQTVSGNIGKPDIVNTAEDLKAALQGGSVSEDILDVGSDITNGGAGDDIIFGDSINTDNLLWNGRFTEGHKDYMIKGQGINALDKFLSLTKDGYSSMSEADKNMAKYDYIKEHHKELNVDGDTRGGDDILSGGEGRDIIYGQGGDDTIITDINTNNGKADGDILIDGGAGFDTVKLEGNSNIDFSKLEDLSITNIEAIDLRDGDHSLTNIRLEDVLKMTDNNNELIILGDDKDSILFKDTIGENGEKQTWSKTAGEGEDKGFDIYVNSGDPTVQVKVEQPISDGITN
ncbi:von Willebrand factor type A (vWA) domain-containing protein [Aliarcobacter trophiarum LMG 25534]|uniref:von Willebrand factor type A (VWA) domain-containing protein n=1 Tax=Aliarcobacter trophiarum LMG 25534 TaxID=1032241 RepID=A0AAD0VM38_9BACT|nr:vWA domain-containing protein [Aliarcobacter trophiarum]AXK48480.1 von Willebrand factor type A (vWA) domain-containing protein [Aliarcobacter trophiarum LMG 25534]